MPALDGHFDDSFRRYARSDPALLDELQRKFGTPTTNERVATAAARSLSFDRARMADEAVMVAHGQRVAETIVRPNARPVLIIRDNQATTEFLGPDSQVWAARIQAAQAVLDKAIPAVGRVEVTNNPDFNWVGTGWLVATDVIVTNRHVAREFGRLGPSGFAFRTGLNGGPMASRIDFLEEAERLASLEYAVASILWIAPSEDADVAFLRVVRKPSDKPLASPVELATEVAADEFVAAIGYPARDPRVPDQDLVRKIFGDVYEKKRLAPGQILEVGPEEITHDCSTLGGNSGSLVMSLNSGKAVGLHFSGLFMEANFAVPATKVRELLDKVRRGELPVASTVRDVAGSPAPVQAPIGPTSPTPGTYTFQFQIPIEITIKVGGAMAAMSSSNLSLSKPSMVSPADVGSSALQAAREALAGDPDIIDIRLGYRFKRGWITDEEVVVVEVRDKVSPTTLRQAGKSLIPPQFAGMGTDVRTAGLASQLESLGIDLRALEGRARSGAYREPANLSLNVVKEPMKAVFHVSPDSGFPNLKAFLGRVTGHVTATMYEWDVNHVSDALAEAIQPDGRTLKMVTQKVTSAGGTAKAVDDMKRRLGDKFEHVWASVGGSGLIPSAYHIKVASRDGQEVWLSSGNWKDSNQADIDPAGDHATAITPLRKHNREWHAIIENATLATLFQQYIEFDFEEAQRVPLEEALVPAYPELFVPEAAFMEAMERRVPVRYFDPLVLDREIEIQPLLTPDRDKRHRRVFMDHALQMIKKGTKKIYVENQSFNLLAEGDNEDEFESFFSVLRDKQRAGVDVRIIFRDGREFNPQNLDQQRLLERIKRFGLDTTNSIRTQLRCHTKGIIVDTEAVLLGSHNLTNAGSLFNRDASLLVRDPEVAGYFEEIFLFDWEILAQQQMDEVVGGIRPARPGEKTPLGYRRVSVAELLGR